ncbi:glycine betaine ABC transporter substrate-binding protein [Methanohalophilus portucalensis]|uniref:Glycine betaine ABC transporter substrate-binding protein n=2 Tax=Methanohalophilus portucalensis TaxID=39664 RepID=A0A1L9C5M9_9EURY|nr:glycine betaine ABC transporter substrate-binding protein [Methanohalophilus portucalensis]ATU08479.1 glycine/betaine ABC transporter [Methanohalophilus portucalensis]OJH49830.1 glycine-betaine binding protein [Methanohalophilus portucalensis FDF-1]RNI13353.1 glycine betaine ABC transporter substrate-binding protein [Methanohalophilus portucalensis FDF-1]SMH33584.1 glycine betaine/proline transport system substrate-binding protein [Methanohalophilus portucalensis FDF-1]
MDNKYKAVIVGILLVLSLFAAGCAQQGDEGEETDNGADEQKTTSIGYVMWDGEIASTNVMKEVLEQAGYEVEIIAVDAGPLYQGLADGQFDFTTSAWLPQTQANYWEQYGDQVDRVAVNLEDCKLGLAVPTYMEDINSIEDLNANKEKFNGKITGIDPGAGIMQNTEDAIDVYGLDYDLEASSSAGMASALDGAYRDEQPIVVTLWTPHWAFGRYDLKMLDDPQQAYGESDNVETLARQGLEEEKPELYAIIGRFNWTHEEIQTVMADMEGGMDAEEAAAKWVENNPDRVNEWIGTE